MFKLLDTTLCVGRVLIILIRYAKKKTLTHTTNVTIVLLYRLIISKRLCLLSEQVLSHPVYHNPSFKTLEVVI